MNLHPFCFDIELTQKCPCFCPYCYLGRPGTGMMDRTTAEQVLRYIEQERQFHPNWKESELNLYGGEPFLNWPIVQYLGEHTVARKTIFTNGATATSEQIEWCREHAITPKRSTAGCPEAASLTRPGFYTEQWIEEGRLWGDYAATHRLTVTPATAPYVVASVRWLHGEDFYGTVDLATDDYSPWPTEAQEEYEEQLTQLAADFIREYKAGWMLGIENFCNFGRAMYGQAGVMVMGCGAGWNTVGVTVSGTIVPCHRWFRDDSPMSQTRLSDVLAGQPVGFGPQFAARLQDVSAGREEHECLGCEARQCCPHGCLHVSHATTNTLTWQPPHRCRFIRLYRRLAENIDRALSPARWWQRSATECQFQEQ